MLPLTTPSTNGPTSIEPIPIGPTTMTMPPPERRIDDLLPLTPAQTGMLFESLSNPDPSMYFEQVRFDLVGSLDLDRFRAAWDTVHARHSMLRTVFLWDGLDDPMQAVLAEVDLAWNVVAPAATDDPDARCGLADACARRRRDDGIDLGVGPISTFDLVPIDAQRTHVIWSFHHLLLDGWSTARVVGEVLDLYEDDDGGGADGDGGSGSDFRPYLEWLADRDAAATTDYWRSLLAGVTEPTALVRRSGPAANGFVRGRVDVALSADDSALVRRSAREHRVTINTMVQGAWARTLARYTGRPDVVFGVTVSGRPPELDGANETVGMFLNTLPFPVSVPLPVTDEAGGDWLQSLQRQQLDVSHHGHASLAEVQRLAAAPSVGALFDSILVFENYPMRSARTDASVVVEHYGVFEQSHYPLTIMAGDLPEIEGEIDGESPALGFIVVHDEARLAPWFVRQLMADFSAELVRLAGSFESATDHTSDAIAIGDTQMASTIAATLDRSTVDAAFARRATANANDIAVRCEGEALTFAQLDARAGRLAGELQRRGVGPEVPVGIAIERSIDMVVAILGTVRAGGCYLALDPSHPIARTSGMLADAAAPIVLVANDAVRDTIAGIPAGETDLRVVDLRSLAGDEPIEVTPPPTTPDATLFLTFTSGSTGRPKGVPVHHRGVLQRLAWQYLAHPPTAHEVGIAKTTLGFVDHLTELWGPLLAGQTVVLAPDATVKDVPAFIDLCAAEQIRRLVVVPSYLEAMLESAPDLGRRLPHLELLTTSGEALAPSLARQVGRALPDVTVLNIYGMSEATADVTVQPLDAAALADVVDGDPVPAGRPLPGLRVAITSDAGAPLPCGVVGSIDVAGTALSAGYWHRPDLTDERFVERTGSDGSVDRWYRTGDLGWLDPSGTLYVVGRSDQQVKIRGMRVELGEIEAAFERHASVARCVAVVRDPGEIVVFVTVGDRLAVTPSGLRAHAATLLPSHMLPTAVLVVDELPRTATGKLDRTALEQRSTTARTGAAEPTPIAADDSVGDELATMLDLWQHVLPNATIGPDTDFFDAGGHSLLALRLLARINREFETELSLAQMLRAPTPRRLTSLVSGDETAADAGGFEYLVPILPGSRGLDDGRRTVFCVHGAGGNVLNFRALAKEIEPAFDMIGIQARGVDGVARPHASMQEVVDDYLPAIRAHQPTGPYLLAGYSGGGTIAVEIARALEATGETVDATLLIDTFHNDTRPRPFTRRQHLEQLRKERFGYLVEKISDKVRPPESENFGPLVSEAQTAGRPIPLEAREWYIKGRMYQLIGEHRIERYDGVVVLLAAGDTHPGLVHTGHDHGLGEVFTNLEIIDVEGDHHSLVEGGNAPELGRLVLERLGVDPVSLGVDGPLDARQHVYRHLPTGLDESPLLTRFVRAGTDALDVGTAATGRSALTLEALGASVVSIEINHDAITEFAASDECRSSNIRLTTADMARLPFADASFDTVLVAFHGFDYLVDPAVRSRAIADLARVLRPGGHLIFNSFNTLGILATPTGARSASSWKRRLAFLRSGELTSRRLVDDNGLGLHHARPGQIIDELERATTLRFETMTTLFGDERHRLLVSAFAPEPNYVFTKR